MLKGIITTLLALVVLACSGTEAEAQNPLARGFNHLNRNMFGGSDCGREITNTQAANLWGGYCSQDCTIYSSLSGSGGGGGGCFGGSCFGGGYGGGHSAAPTYSAAPAYSSAFGHSGCGGCKIKRMIGNVFSHGGSCGCGQSYFGYSGGGCGGCGSGSCGTSGGFGGSYLGYGSGGGHRGCCLKRGGCGGGGCGSYSSGYASYAAASYAPASYASTGCSGYASTGYAGYSSACGSRHGCGRKGFGGRHRLFNRGGGCGCGGCRLFSHGGIHDRMFSSFYVANSTCPSYFGGYVGNETGFSDFNSSVSGSLTSSCGCSSCGGGAVNQSYYSPATSGQSYYSPQPAGGGYVQPSYVQPSYVQPTLASPMHNGYSN